MKRCSHCGRDNEDVAVTCHECGTAFVADQPKPEAPAGWDRIATLEYEVEAEQLESELDGRGIPYLMVSHCDSAFDGIFQTSQGWGHLEAPKECRDAIVSILTDIRQSRRESDHAGQKEAAPNDAAERPDSRRPQMNEDINREILTELRSIRRLAQWSLWLPVLAGALGVVLGAYFAFARPQFLRSRFAREVDAYQRAQRQAADNRDPWAYISAALDRGDSQEALSLAQSYVERQPGYYYAHACLGGVYIALNDFTNAETAYVRAVELYPCEEYEKALAAVRKRLAREQAK